MNCRGVEEQEILERYLLGRLSDPALTEFEQHFFECDSCFSQVQTRLALQEELRQHPPARTLATGFSFRQMWLWAPAFAALALVLAAGIWWQAARRLQPAQQTESSRPAPNPQVSLQSQPPSPSLEELAHVEAPPYSAVVLRGAEDKAQQDFQEAMQHYLKRDYLGAIAGLRAAAKASPETPSFHFYLGACYLLTGQTDPAIVSFRQTVSLGDPSYSESAHFYLAKAYLSKREVSTAEDELQKTVQFHGNMEAEAVEILRQLRK
jgi:hypothetical protein